jgi:hypothetical protein
MRINAARDTEDLTAERLFLRRSGDLGRWLAGCCQARQFARIFDQPELAELCWLMFIGTVPQDRKSFLEWADAVVRKVEQIRTRLITEADSPMHPSQTSPAVAGLAEAPAIGHRDSGNQACTDAGFAIAERSDP